MVSNMISNMIKKWMKTFLLYSVICVVVSVLFDLLINHYKILDERLLYSLSKSLLLSLMCSVLHIFIVVRQNETREDA